MTTELSEEAKALVAAAERFRKAESALEQRRIELADAIRTAGRRSEPPKRLGGTAIAKLTGYSRGHVLRIIDDE